MRRPCALIAAGTLLLSVALASAGGAFAVPVVPQVHVLLDPVAPVDVDRDLDAVVSTNGTVNVTLPPSATFDVHVYLNVSINNTFWFATIDPMASTFVGSGEVHFHVNVTVPGRVSLEPSAEIYVDANVSVAPGLGKSWTGSTPVPIVQYFGVAVTPSTSSSPANFTAAAGNDTGFSLRVQNQGNGQDSIELHIDNIADLQANGISVYLPSPISVPAKATVNVNGNVTIPASLTSGNFTLSLSAFSTGAAAKGETVSAAGSKEIHVVPHEDDGGAGSTTNTNGTKGKGFLPGPDAAMALAATAAAAVIAAARRVRRP